MTPTFGEVPGIDAISLWIAASATSSAKAPASTLAPSSSMTTSRMRSVLIRIVSSSDPRATAPWPVPCPVTLRPFLRAKPITLETSSALSTSATASGRWSAARFQAWRASSQPESLEVVISPRMDSSEKSATAAHSIAPQRRSTSVILRAR